VLHYACLEEDLKMFPKGIDTEIGEKGINLSGGQKARISLARSLYSDRDILLLDDILSAVDIHVGEFIVKDTVKGFMKGKTVLMPTHAIKFAPDADEIIMKKGRIVRKGAYSLICDTPEFKEISHKEETKETTHKEEIEDEKLVAEITMLKDVMEHKAHSHDQSA
jgi:ATP-binding cassette, subfamily C (CFTR/MRP), member 2